VSNNIAILRYSKDQLFIGTPFFMDLDKAFIDKIHAFQTISLSEQHFAFTKMIAFPVDLKRRDPFCHALPAQQAAFEVAFFSDFLHQDLMIGQQFNGKSTESAFLFSYKGINLYWF
jgi:hypothetical protein